MSDLVLRDEPQLPDPEQGRTNWEEAVVIAREARAWIAERGELELAKELRRRLAAYEKYVTDRAGQQAIKAESRFAEVLIGKLLGPAASPGRPAGNSTPRTNSIRTGDRVDFRRLAANEAEVERQVDAGTVDRKAILRQIERREVEQRARSLAVDSGLRCGDFRDVLADVPDESVALIYTDPPYARTAIPLYEDLAELAARVLVPGGSLLAYCGQYALPEVIERMGRHLRWWWLCGCYHEGGQHRSLPGVKTYVLWKPIVWYVKDTNGATEFVYDLIARPAPSKEQHDWAQSAVDAEHYIAKLTRPDDLVLDPFAGSGTTLLAAKQLDRRYLGAESDPVIELRAREALTA